MDYPIIRTGPHQSVYVTTSEHGIELDVETPMANAIVCLDETAYLLLVASLLAAYAERCARAVDVRFRDYAG